MLAEIPANLYYEERRVFRYVIKKIRRWIFETGIESGKIVPPWVIVGFYKQKDSINKLLITLHLIG